MQITYQTGKSDPNFNKVAAIKAVRAFNRMGLKESKEAVETAVECGQFNIPDGQGCVVDFREAMMKAGNFNVTTSELELIAAIEHTIVLAVQLRDYKRARALINTLPAKLRAGHSLTEQN